MPDSENRRHFISQIIDEDLANKRHNTIVTRFPPEPNGYLHIGHAKSICLNFGLANTYQGQCHLRFDDTNPIKEEDEYVTAIINDLNWLGFTWDDATKYASDYFPKFYQFACDLIHDGKAYVDSLNAEEIRLYRGTLTTPGKPSPYRDRSPAENLDLFRRMKAGDFANGEHVLRAKIDMASPNINLRDPVLYRILHTDHQRTGANWCIYPMYDYAHPISDALEGITHSLCTLEFQDHRPLYDWILTQLKLEHTPKQYEFARLNLSHTITSKRKLKQLIDGGHVNGWDDPRLPTLQGMRQRGYPPQAIKNFCESIGISKSDSLIDMGLLEEQVRDELNQTAPRAMAILNPLKVTIENLDEPIQIAAPRHPNLPELGERTFPLTREIYIEAEDFMEVPVKKFFRLAPGQEVRLRNAHIIKCTDVIKDDTGKLLELRCQLDPDTFGKNPTDRKVKGVIHWVSVDAGQAAEIRLYDRLFTIEDPSQNDDICQSLNPDSLKVIHPAWVEPSLAKAQPDAVFQFERNGYFRCAHNAQGEGLIFNQIASLRNNWRK